MKMNAMVRTLAENTWIWQVFQDVKNLQGELNKTYIWADLNNKNFNCEKFKAGRFKVSLWKEEIDAA